MEKIWNSIDKAIYKRYNFFGGKRKQKIEFSPSDFGEYWESFSTRWRDFLSFNLRMGIATALLISLRHRGIDFTQILYPLFVVVGALVVGTLATLCFAKIHKKSSQTNKLRTGEIVTILLLTLGTLALGTWFFTQ